LLVGVLALRICNCMTNIKKFNLFYIRYRFLNRAWIQDDEFSIELYEIARPKTTYSDGHRSYMTAGGHLFKRAVFIFFWNTRCTTHIRHYQHINTYLIVLVPRQDFIWYPFIKSTCTNPIRWSVVQASWIENAVRQKCWEETCFINVADTFLNISHLFYMSTEMPKKLRMTDKVLDSKNWTVTHKLSYDLRRRRRPWQN
jgi:hypothetical protein